MRRLLVLLALLAWPAGAEEIVLGLSEDEVAITATFDGAGILIFGAVKRDGPAPDAAPLEVAITVSGPPEPLIVRQSERRLGIWVNAAAVEVDRAPSFYAVATTAPLARMLTDTEDLRHSVTLPRAIRAIGNEVADREPFLDALLRVRLEEGRWQVLEGEVEFDEQTLFRTRIALPANLTEGSYAARIFLTRDGVVVDSLSTAIDVRKVGLERWLHRLATERSPLYGLLALAIAILAGWGASAAFQALRG